MAETLRVVCGTVFFPRGGSAFVTRALVRGLVDLGDEPALLSGSRHDADGLGDARAFYGGLPLHEVDFTPALAAPDPVRWSGPPGTAPLHPSFEDRPGAPDVVFAALDEDAFEVQVAAWTRELRAVGGAAADVLHLHHLTPLHESAARAAPGVPVVTQLHGTELLMLEAIADGPPPGWAHAEAWARRLRGWAAGSARLLVAPGGVERAARLLDVPPERFAELPNGIDPAVFRPREVDRHAVWRDVLPDATPGELDALAAGPVVVYVGRFTAVKRLPLLLAAFAAVRGRTRARPSLVLVGGHPGEWEGEHPAAAATRLGLHDVHLAGWHEQSELPRLLCASDVLVLPSARESFGQVLVEAMACGVPPVAAASLGPARIVADGVTGWLFDVDDARGLEAALAAAIDDPAERARRGRAAIGAARECFAWPALAARLHRVLSEAAAGPARRGARRAPRRARRAPRPGAQPSR